MSLPRRILPIALPFLAVLAIAGRPARPLPAHPLPFAGQDLAGCERQQTIQGTRAPYRRRGTRCEGYFAQPLSSTPVRILAYGAAEPSPAADRPSAPITWSPSSLDSVRIRAELRQSLGYYQMDTRVPAGPGRFEWQLDAVQRARLQLRDFDVLCWTRRQAGVDSRPVQVLVPCQLGSAARRAPALVLVAHETLLDVHVSLFQADGRGGERALYTRRRLPGGPFTDGARMPIPLAEAAAPGMYRLVVMYAGPGGDDTADYWLYANGSPR